ncbi:hypothetical protein [Streptomyces sp. NPDC056660]|uniref:hypothetical protein n=1 Tax=Streptomyces sp. NPDC056660 TaxID=3345897 RepID=UPI0036ACA9D6
MLTSPRPRAATRPAHTPDDCPVRASGPHGPRLMARNARILELAVRHSDPHSTPGSLPPR